MIAKAKECVKTKKEELGGVDIPLSFWSSATFLQTFI